MTEAATAATKPKTNPSRAACRTPPKSPRRRVSCSGHPGPGAALRPTAGGMRSWGRKGYWTTLVRNSIISSVPFAGDFLLRLLQGAPPHGDCGAHAVLRAARRIAALDPREADRDAFPFPDPAGARRTHRRGPLPPAGPSPSSRSWSTGGSCSSSLARPGSDPHHYYWPASLESPADPTDSAYVRRPRRSTDHRAGPPPKGFREARRPAAPPSGRCRAADRCAHRSASSGSRP